MIWISLALLAWCALSLPLGILVGRRLRRSAPQEVPSNADVALSELRAPAG